MGRRIPNERDRNPPLYRMRIFAPDAVCARSRFWYFIKRLKKVKKTSGEICFCGIVSFEAVVNQFIFVCRDGHSMMICYLSALSIAIWFQALTLLSFLLSGLSAGERHISHQDQECGHLVEVRLSQWDTQHVQRVPRPHSGWSCHPVL